MNVKVVRVDDDGLALLNRYTDELYFLGGSFKDFDRARGTVSLVVKKLMAWAEEEAREQAEAEAAEAEEEQEKARRKRQTARNAALFAPEPDLCSVMDLGPELSEQPCLKPGQSALFDKVVYTYAGHLPYMAAVSLYNAGKIDGIRQERKRRSKS